MSDAKSKPSVDVTEDSRGPLSFSLEIRGGQTGYRRRPILGDRFLIGSDPICDLRLDGRLGAPLHCLIRRDGACLEAEPLTNVPMTLNGVPTTHAILKEGDTLGIGQLRLIVHVHAIRFDVVRPIDDLNAPHIQATSPNFRRDLSSRSVNELVDLVDIEEERVYEFASRQRAGVAALLDAVHQSRRPAPDANAEDASSSLEGVVSQPDCVAEPLTDETCSPSESGDRATGGDIINLARWQMLQEIRQMRKTPVTVAGPVPPRRTAS